MTIRSAAALAGACLLICAAAAGQNVTMYDDAVQNGFDGSYSYGGGTDFASTAQAHGGTKSIAFTGNNYNAVAMAHPTVNYTTAAYPTLHFWVHGGTTGGQQLTVQLYLDDNFLVGAQLDGFISGGAPAANVWREVTVTLAQLPYAGSFDRVDIQSDSPGVQATLYIDDVVLQVPASQPSATMQIEQGVTVGGMVSDRFTWKDSNNESRVAVLAHNNGQVGPGGTRGGELRELRYQVDGQTRTAAASSAGAAGFGYVVSHPVDGAACLGGFDSSSLGHFTTGSFTRVFAGRHHAIFRFTQNYPRYCQTGANPPNAAIDLPVTIDWVFSTGRDHPLWAITYDMSGIAVNTLNDDARAPYGELLFDGSATEGAHSQVSGVAWGDRYKFTTTTAPVTYGSSWTWNVANTIPYVKLWTTAVDATMGTVQTQTITQQDAGGYWGTGSWTKTSDQGNGCTDPDQNVLMPCDYNWPYQSINYSIYGGATRNTRLAWGTNFGFLGQNTYSTHGFTSTASGWPRRSYSVYVVLGKHTAGPVEAQVTQIETIQTLTLSATTGSVVTSGPAGVGRPDTVTYAPAGYDHVYGALAFSASANQLDANIAVGAGILKNPLIIVRNFTSVADPAIKLAGATLVADTDYFASLRSSASELWITLRRNLTGATNHLEVIAAGGAAPAAPTGLAATAASATQVGLTWTAVGTATSYAVDRKGAGGDYIQIATPAGNSYTDNGVTAGNAYLYRVRAVNGSGTSGNSTPDLATTVVFTNHPLAAGITIQAAHIAQLRTAVNAVRALASLGASAFTDTAAAGTAIRGLHITELRTALDAARTQLTLSTGGYTDGAVGGVAVKAIHIQELRTRVE